MEATPAPTPQVEVATPPIMERCPACGTELQPGGAFCSSCGHRLVPIAPLAQTTSPAEERVPFAPKKKSPRRKADATPIRHAVQAEEPSTAPTALVTKAEKFALIDTLTVLTVESVAISPDGHTLVGSDYSTIKVWSLQSGKLLRTLSGHIDSVSSVAISPDGHTLVSGSDDQTIKVWSLQKYGSVP